MKMKQLGVLVFCVLFLSMSLSISDMPKEFNHFKAYRVVKADFEPKVVLLKDQWDGKPIKVKVIKPFLFCNPVVKVHEKMKAPIYNEGCHLTCCYIDPKGVASSPKSIEIMNQLGKHRLHPQQYFVLCVPTDKLGFKVMK